MGYTCLKVLTHFYLSISFTIIFGKVFIKLQLEHKVLFSKYINVHYSIKRKCLNHLQ